MAAQGEQGQGGLENKLMEPEAQDTAMQVVHPPQPNSEFVMGTVGGAAQERPLRQISPSVPCETATDPQIGPADRIMGRSIGPSKNRGSVLLESSGIERLVQMMQ